NTRNPAHLSGVFYCLKFSLSLSEPGLSDRSRSSFLISFLIWSTSCLVDISPSIQLLNRKSTECDASTFLVMPALL
ncbi:hypothetical protein, partial [Aeromonas hydrophila]|uniref:hypothetical protein n=1 Tax=Aeromonas hydrophila TaxID=644 RepID=UPI001E5604A7